MFKTLILTLTLKVSEEETFEDNKALWWSPDSSRLVYGVFDDTNVDVLQLPRFSNLKDEVHSQAAISPGTEAGALPRRTDLVTHSFKTSSMISSATQKPAQRTLWWPWWRQTWAQARGPSSNTRSHRPRVWTTDRLTSRR